MTQTAAIPEQLAPGLLTSSGLQAARPLLEVLPHPVLLLGAGGRIRWANAAAQRFYGGCTGHCHELLHGTCLSCPESAECPRARAQVTGRPSCAVHAHRTQGSHGFFHVTALPLGAGEVLEIHVPLEDSLTRDSLTGAHTRSFFEQLAERELSLLERLGKPFGAVILDVDGLKRINDGHGHEAGDVVLEAVGGVLLATVRDADCVGRIGGDEFCLFLPTADRDAVWKVARRVQHALHRTRLAPPLDGLEVRASLGLHASVGGYVLRTAIARADQGLYEAKRSGGDRIVGV